jgi:alpha-D-ribose 1-methylphosphonate 5-triphosphate synthase subunit PhnH
MAYSPEKNGIIRHLHLAFLGLKPQATSTESLQLSLKDMSIFVFLNPKSKTASRIRHHVVRMQMHVQLRECNHNASFLEQLINVKPDGGFDL